MNTWPVLFYDRRMANSRGHASAPISLLRNEYVFFPSPRIMGHHRIISNLQSPTKDLLIIDFYVRFALKYQLDKDTILKLISLVCYDKFYVTILYVTQLYITCMIRKINSYGSQKLQQLKISYFENMLKLETSNISYVSWNIDKQTQSEADNASFYICTYVCTHIK